MTLLAAIFSAISKSKCCRGKDSLVFEEVILEEAENQVMKKLREAAKGKLEEKLIPYVNEENWGKCLDVCKELIEPAGSSSSGQVQSSSSNPETASSSDRRPAGSSATEQVQSSSSNPETASSSERQPAGSSATEQVQSSSSNPETASSSERQPLLPQ